MAEKIADCTFTLVEPTGFYKRALVTVNASKTVTKDDTITLPASTRVNTIIAVHSHVAATGVPNTYAYAANVLTKTTEAATKDVLEILFE